MNADEMKELHDYDRERAALHVLYQAKLADKDVTHAHAFEDDDGRNYFFGEDAEVLADELCFDLRCATLYGADVNFVCMPHLLFFGAVLTLQLAGRTLFVLRFVDGKVTSIDHDPTPDAATELADLKPRFTVLNECFASALGYLDQLLGQASKGHYLSAKGVDVLMAKRNEMVQRYAIALKTTPEEFALRRDEG
jgi:hypothetical protein